MTLTRVVALITALLMIAFGVFWMFMWLIGTNGYSESKGLSILVSNLVLVIVSIIGASIVSSWLVQQIQTKMALPPWLIAPLAITVVLMATGVVLFAGSLVIIAVVGTSR